MYVSCNNSKHKEMWVSPKQRKLDSWNSGFLCIVTERKKCNRENMWPKWELRANNDFFLHCKGPIGRGLSLRRKLGRQKGRDCCLRMHLQERNGFKVTERKCVAMPSLGLGWKDARWTMSMDCEAVVGKTRSWYLFSHVDLGGLGGLRFLCRPPGSALLGACVQWSKHLHVPLSPAFWFVLSRWVII